jgi:formate dehydrogenase subunit gamma
MTKKLPEPRPEDGMADVVKAIVDANHQRAGALLPILHEIQRALGYVPSDGVPLIAEKLNLSRAEVHGVISFYHHFRNKPSGRNVIKICRAEACQAVGSRALEAYVESSLSLKLGESSPDGNITLEPVYCLGNCASGPSVQVGDEVYARVTPERFDALAAEVEGN